MFRFLRFDLFAAPAPRLRHSRARACRRLGRPAYPI